MGYRGHSYLGSGNIADHSLIITTTVTTGVITTAAAAATLPPLIFVYFSTHVKRAEVLMKDRLILISPGDAINHERVCLEISGIYF